MRHTETTEAEGWNSEAVHHDCQVCVSPEPEVCQLSSIPDIAHRCLMCAWCYESRTELLPTHERHQPSISLAAARGASLYSFLFHTLLANPTGSTFPENPEEGTHLLSSLPTSPPSWPTVAASPVGPAASSHCLTIPRRPSRPLLLSSVAPTVSQVKPAASRGSTGLARAASCPLLISFTSPHAGPIPTSGLC